jgi:hypothetical protein
MGTKANDSVNLFILLLFQDKPSSPKKLNVMDDRPEKLKIIPDHFQIPTSSVESTGSRKSSTTEEPRIDQSLRYCLLVNKGIEKSNNKTMSLFEISYSI